MKKLNQILFSLTVVCGLSLSLPAFASQQDFVLKNAEDAQLGLGNYEELPHAMAKVVVTINNLEYSGTANISSQNAKTFSNGLRTNRGLLTTKIKRQVSVELVASDNSKLTCELNRLYSDVWGQCVDAASQQTFVIKNSL